MSTVESILNDLAQGMHLHRGITRRDAESEAFQLYMDWGIHKCILELFNLYRTPNQRPAAAAS